MKIVFAASEAAGLLKTGGLGDVARALPLALSEKRGQEVSLFLPYYGQMKKNEKIRAEKLMDFTVRLSWRKQYCGLYRVKSKKRKLAIYLIDNEYYFCRDRVYGEGDDGERFAFFSMAILESLVKLGLRPDIIHANDWQTAFIPTFLHAFYHKELGSAKTVFTIHNIEYQGWAHPYFLGDVLGLSTEYESTFSFDGSVNFLKGAILSTDALTTVSESYARELRRAEFAHGLQDILSEHAFKTRGIVNGIDPKDASPELDPALPCNYTVDTAREGKACCKAALQKEVGLPVRSDVPLVGMVSRLVAHKGLELLRFALEEWMSWDAQFVILGTGDAQYEEMLASLAARFPDRIAFVQRFSTELASRIYAGSDLYLMPSKSEPCGLSQMIAMRYGSVPMVHETGGLRDTVPPYDPNTDEGVGFTFRDFNHDALFDAFRRALTLYATDQEAWQELVKRGMTRDLSWKKGAEAYLDLYRDLTGIKQ
ncbi:MAG: glycogen synthase [Ruminococcaceae bacterium]|nr:glycogen synthase [Oscillospiraceae bacterium]